MHFIKYIFRIKSAIGESSTIIFDWYVSPDEIYTNTELYSYVSPFGGQKKISSGIADVTVEYVTSPDLKIQASCSDNASHQTNLYPVEITVVSFTNAYPLGDLSHGYRFPASKQLGPCARVEDIFWLLLMMLFFLY